MRKNFAHSAGIFGPKKNKRFLRLFTFSKKPLLSRWKFLRRLHFHLQHPRTAASQLAGIRSYTLIELLVVVTIIVIFSIISLGAYGSMIESARVAKAGLIQSQMTKAIELYHFEVGFYPPDVNRGWDPGLVQALPWNADTAAGDPPGGSYATAGENCDHCPANWENIVQERWNGPYISLWPRFTPWDGKYDYNYWPTGTDRGGCSLPAGIYIGVQGDYENNNVIPSSAEDKMIEKKFEFENCKNGESQILLVSLE